jgi:hypothetical protein
MWKYNCNMFGRLETGFELVIGFINNPQVVTTINYYTIVALHNVQSLHTNLLTLSALVFSPTESHTPNKAFKSYVQAFFLPRLSRTKHWLRTDWLFRNSSLSYKPLIGQAENAACCCITITSTEALLSNERGAASLNLARHSTEKTPHSLLLCNHRVYRFVVQQFLHGINMPHCSLLKAVRPE